MNKIIFTLVTAFIFSSAAFGAQAQDILGRWYGLLHESGAYSKVILTVEKDKTKDAYYAVFENTAQKEKTPVTAFSFDNPDVYFKIIDLAAEYKGSLDKDGIIKGIFKQNETELNVNFSRNQTARIQDPLKPYPYTEEDIVFENKKAEIKLAATLTVPQGKTPFAAVVLISGNGPQNRDEEIFGHKPFLVIADYLTRNGIAVLRYDDRGVANSEGHFGSAQISDFVSDVQSAVEYLKTRKEIDEKNIGLIGYGEGAAIASITASEDNDISFIILLAAQGVSGKNIILKQTELINKAAKTGKKQLKRDLRVNKKSIEIMTDTEDISKTRGLLIEYLGKAFDDFSPAEVPKGMGKTDFMRAYINMYTNPRMLDYLNYNPAETLKKVKCPVFAVWGAKDLQISAKENFKAVKKALEEGGNKNFALKIFARLNHLFQECNTGLPEEYRQIEQTFAPEVLEEILKKIKGFF
ncbi:MAG: alpha/beta hydrolase [Endomicrobium sp.]|nr:alpha/beta hydrolase [Endomicrobium sp.]